MGMCRVRCVECGVGYRAIVCARRRVPAGTAAAMTIRTARAVQTHIAHCLTLPFLTSVPSSNYWAWNSMKLAPILLLCLSRDLCAVSDFLTVTKSVVRYNGGRCYLGFEVVPEYYEFAKQRLEQGVYRIKAETRKSDLLTLPID